MKSQKIIKYAFASVLVLASSQSFALTFEFSFTNTIGNTAGTVTGEVFGLVDNATTAATDVLITSYPSAMTGLPPTPFSVVKLPGSGVEANSFPVYNGQVQTDGNLGHGLFYFSSYNLSAADWNFCMSGFGFATQPCPTTWFESHSPAWTNITRVETHDFAQFTPVPEPSEVPLPAALPLFATGLGALGLLGWRRKRKAQAA